jgi:acetylglutamate kinase
LKRKILMKLSGKLIDKNTFREMIDDIQALHAQDVLVALVHGGGKTISHYLNAQKVPSEFIDGLRSTNGEAIKIVEMVLAGLINKQLTRWLNAANLPATGISGSDCNLILASQISHELGFVGNIEKINPRIINILWQNNMIAVIAPTGTGSDHDCLNINADVSAGALAGALEVDSLFFFTDAEGVLTREGKLDTLSARDIPEFIESGQAREGMIPKLLASRTAKRSGIRQVKISAWQGKGTLMKLLNGANLGTEIM